MQYKVLFERMNSRYLLTWGVPPVLVAAEMALLPLLLRTRSFGSLTGLGVGGSTLGFLSYQLFSYHHHCKKLDEQSLAWLELSHARLLLHGNHHRLQWTNKSSEHLQPPMRTATPVSFVHRWAGGLPAPLIWHYALLFTAVLPLGLAALRSRPFLRARKWTLSAKEVDEY